MPCINEDILRSLEIHFLGSRLLNHIGRFVLTKASFTIVIFVHAQFFYFVSLVLCEMGASLNVSAVSTNRLHLSLSFAILPHSWLFNPVLSRPLLTLPYHLNFVYKIATVYKYIRRAG